MVLATRLTQEMGEASPQDATRHEPVQLVEHKLGQCMPTRRVGPHLLEAQKVFLEHAIERSLLRLPPDIGWAGLLDAGGCLHIWQLSANRRPELPAAAAAATPSLRCPSQPPPLRGSSSATSAQRNPSPPVASSITGPGTTPSASTMSTIAVSATAMPADRYGCHGRTGSLKYMATAMVRRESAKENSLCINVRALTA
jgi:hypothetical protein